MLVVVAGRVSGVYYEIKLYRFLLINESNKDFHYKVSQSIVGGPSIVFNQVNIAGEIQIRVSENVCRKIQGYDANSLYP